MHLRKLLVTITVGVHLLAGAAEPTFSPPLNQAMLKGFKGRAIGPAVMGGRVSDLAFDPRNPHRYYAALATGGVWKTDNNGTTFKPIFDEEPVQSIGAVAVAPSDPDVVWVGTGEGNDRNSSGWGNGVYVSTNGGAKWRNVGLTTSRAIRRLAIHPTNPRLAYVAAGGSLWAAGGERGLYKTEDAGATWQLVLGAPKPHDALTGCADVVMDPKDPNTLYAALYARVRRPWGFFYGVNCTEGGADVGGIFKTTDAGATWSQLTNGLPGLTGRIGLAVCASKPNVLMAVVQSDEGGTSDIDENTSRRGGIFRSEDGGRSWTRVNRLNPRPFYFSRIEIDPANDQRIYVMGWLLFVSDDGGRNFRENAFGKVHADVHALFIQPGTTLPEKATPDGEKPGAAPICQRLVMGTDGGIYASFDAGATWDFLNTIPAGQYYRIEVDQSAPYRIAGGLQDNCNWVGPSRTYSKEGIRNADWTMIGGGDGFYCVFDAEDPNVIYAESQGGEVHRFNARTGEIRGFAPKPTEGQARFRFQWNAPLIASLHQKDVMYLAGNRVFKLTRHAQSFETISPDLSYNQPDKTTSVGSTAENYAAVYALAESPLKPGRLFAGTDDGRLWVTENEGRDWVELTGNIPVEARGKWVARIEPSHFDDRSGYVVLTGYRDGDDTAYVYRYAELGKEWHRLNSETFTNNPAVVLREDPVNANLLYLGTEFGLFASLDAGRTWAEFGGLPPVRIDDLKIQSRDADLVVGTHGRSLYVVDDTRALRELSPAVAARAAHLFSIRPAHGRYLLAGWEDSLGKGWYKGENPPEGALLTVWFKEFTGEKFSLTIADASDHTVAKFEQTAVPGFTRLSWDLRVGKDFRNDYGGDKADRFVAPGDYTATLTFKDAKVKQTFKVTTDPGVATHGTFR